MSFSFMNHGRKSGGAAGGGSQRAVVALELERWPTIARVYEACLAHPAFDAALPKRQPGFVDIKEH
jgi:hypothetical protein